MWVGFVSRVLVLSNAARESFAVLCRFVIRSQERTAYLSVMALVSPTVISSTVAAIHDFRDDENSGPTAD